MFDLFDDIKGDHSRIGAAKVAKSNLFVDSALLEKLQDAEGKLEKLELHFEYLATAAEKSEKLTQANRT